MVVFATVVGKDYILEVCRTQSEVVQLGSLAVVADTLLAGRMGVVDMLEPPRIVAVVVDIEGWVENMQVVGCKAVDKLEQVVHRILVEKSHNSHLEERYMALGEEGMVS